MHFHQVATILATVCLFVTVGCRKADEDKPDVDSKTKIELPVVNQTVEEIREEMVQYEPFSLQFEDSRLKLAVVFDAIRKREGVEGFQDRESPPEFSRSPSVYSDTKTGKVAWRALHCLNPECPGEGLGGGPFLFTRPFSHVTVGADGQLIIGEMDMEEMMKPVYCPACRDENYIRPYDLPESAVRERALKTELDRIYAAYAKAARKGTAMPKNVRSPQDIMNDLNALPKLFLVVEPGKVKEFDAVTAPISGGFASGAK